MIRQAIFASLTAALLLPACGGDSSPTSPGSPGSTGPPPGAPTADSPAKAAALTMTQPNLIVRNATGGSGPRTYTFEVAPDRNFNSIEATVQGVAEGNGTTSWQVSPPLDTGMQHWWRVKATASGSEGPYSEIINFSIRDSFATNQHTGGLVVWDPLTNGSSIGTVVGGRFVEQGWRLQTRNHYIRYSVPTLEDGYVEFDVTNIREPNPSPGSRMLMSMWDPSKGEYTQNPFRMHLQKLDRNTVRFDDVRLRWISRGEQADTGVSFFDFVAEDIYHWRVEWGNYRGLEKMQVKVFIDGIEIMVRNYSKTYHPATHWIELGNQERAEGLEEAIYSNVKIGNR